MMNNQEALDFIKFYWSIRETTDVFLLYIKSLTVTAIQANYRKQILCNICGEFGHTCRLRCPFVPQKQFI